MALARSVLWRLRLNSKRGVRMAASAQPGLDRSGSLADYLSAVWRYRHLILHLARSDLRARFRGSYLGAVWLVVNPLIFTAIFTVIFGTIFGIPVREYAPYVLVGIVLWDFISSIASASTTSILAAEGYLKQSRIPLLAFCLRTLIFFMVCFLFGSLTMFVVAAIANPAINAVMWLWFVPATVLAVYFAAPLGIISAVTNTRFRDYQQGIAHMLMVLYYLSPIFIVRKEFERPELKVFSDYNPITSLCDLFRDPVLYGLTPSMHDAVVVLVWGLALWLIAAIALSRTERDMIFYF